MQLFTTLAGTVFIAVLLFAASMLTSQSSNLPTVRDTLKPAPKNGLKNPLQSSQLRTLRQLANFLEFVRVRDTVYVLGDRFIEVNLQTQHLTLRYRTGDSLLIPISSGNPEIKEAIATPTGIFSIQSKTPEATSRQFGNTKMLWWIGFNYNVGFHGLEPNGYYRYLGKRPSSHGCIRTAREDVKRLYDEVETGVPVIVFDAEPARILAFADSTTPDTTKALRIGSRTRVLMRLTEDRLHLLYSGKQLAEQAFSMYIPHGVQLRPGGYRVGTRDSLTNAQVHPTTITSQSHSAPQDNCKVLFPFGR
jgi:hypothetical protein